MSLGFSFAVVLVLMVMATTAVTRRTVFGRRSLDHLLTRGARVDCARLTPSSDMVLLADELLEVPQPLVGRLKVLAQRLKPFHQVPLGLAAAAAAAAVASRRRLLLLLLLLLRNGLDRLGDRGL